MGQYVEITREASMQRLIQSSVFFSALVLWATPSVAAGGRVTDGFDRSGQKFQIVAVSQESGPVEIRLTAPTIRNLQAISGIPFTTQLQAGRTHRIQFSIPDTYAQSYITWQLDWRRVGGTSWSRASQHSFAGTFSPASAPTVTDGFDPARRQFRVMVQNRMNSAIEFRVSADAGMRNLSARGPNPWTITVPANGQGTVTWNVTDPGQQSYITWRAEFRPQGGTQWLAASQHTFAGTMTPGSSTSNQRDSYFAGGLYLIPYGRNATYTMSNGPNGYGWHAGKNAYDWPLPMNTMVLCARSGTVVSLKKDSNRGGASQSYQNDANYIQIRHDDGTIANYLHFAYNSILVRVGQRVTVGEELGRSGNTGWTTQPHLHFHVSNAAGNVTYRLRFLTRNGPVDPASGTRMTGYYPWMP